jgi:hypothetical protein
MYHNKETTHFLVLQAKQQQQQQQQRLPCMPLTSVAANAK